MRIGLLLIFSSSAAAVMINLLHQPKSLTERINSIGLPQLKQINSSVKSEHVLSLTVKYKKEIQNFVSKILREPHWSALQVTVRDLDFLRSEEVVRVKLGSQIALTLEIDNQKHEFFTRISVFMPQDSIDSAIALAGEVIRASLGSAPRARLRDFAANLAALDPGFRQELLFELESAGQPMAVRLDSPKKISVFMVTRNQADNARHALAGDACRPQLLQALRSLLEVDASADPSCVDRSRLPDIKKVEFSSGKKSIVRFSATAVEVDSNICANIDPSLLVQENEFRLAKNAEYQKLVSSFTAGIGHFAHTSAPLPGKTITEVFIDNFRGFERLRAVFNPIVGAVALMSSFSEKFVDPLNMVMRCQGEKTLIFVE